jgi:hypothetical protein
METYLSIIGIALGVGALVPIFAVKDPGKKVILVSIIVAIMGIFAISLWKNHEHAQKVEAIKHDVMTELEKRAAAVGFFFQEYV